MGRRWQPSRGDARAPKANSQSYVELSACLDNILAPHLYRDAGLAAVAAELKLPVNTLEPEVAEAVETGAAALFLAGYGPRVTRSQRKG